MGERSRAPEVEVRNYHSKIKAELFSMAASRFESPSLVDLGAGRGADCKRYKKFRKVIAVDADSEALETLKQRAQKYRQEVTTVNADMTEVSGPSVHVVSAMFCAHYVCGTHSKLQDFAACVSRLLIPGGLFIGLDMDGAAVNKCLATGKRRFTDWACLELSGKDHVEVTIASISEQPRTEPLFCWPRFVNFMSSAGLVLEDTAMLTPEAFVQDIDLAEFSGLHRWWVFKKDCSRSKMKIE